MYIERKSIEGQNLVRFGGRQGSVLLYSIAMIASALNIRTTILDTCRKKDVCKALALSLCVKNKVQSSRIDRFSYNKLHELTGLHAITLRKRMKTLENLGLVKREGNSVLFLSVSSKHKGRNCKIIINENYTVKDIQDSIYKTMIAVFQNRKDLPAHLQLLAEGRENSFVSKKNYDLFRKKCCSVGFRRGFVDFGISYKALAFKLGISARKAFSVVCSAVKERYVEKRNNVRPINTKDGSNFIKYANESDKKNYCLFFGAKLYELNSNTYSLGGIGLAVVPSPASTLVRW